MNAIATSLTFEFNAFHLFWQIFCHKVNENFKKLDREGGCASLAPPAIRQCNLLTLWIWLVAGTDLMAADQEPIHLLRLEELPDDGGAPRTNNTPRIQHLGTGGN